MLPPRHALLALIAGLSTGCVDYTPAPVSVEQMDRAYAARKLPPKKQAWSVQELIELGRKYQASRAHALAKYEAAQAAVVTAGGRPNPTLSLIPGVNTSANGSPSGIPAVSLDLFFESAGKKDLRLLKAQQQLLSAGFALQEEGWQLDNAVRHACWNLHYALEREALLTQEVAALGKVLGQARLQLGVGLIASTEMQTQELALRKAKLDLADAVSTKLDGRAQLAEAIGVPAQALAKAKLDLAFALPSRQAAHLSVERVRRNALTRRPDVAMSLADYAAEEANLALEVARQYPDIKVSPGYQWDQGSNKWQLGLAADLPIFNQNQGPIGEAMAQRKQAKARVEVAQAKVAAEVDRVVPALQQAWNAHQAALELTKTQGESKAAAERRLQVGQGEPTEALLAEVDLIVARIALIDRAYKLTQQVEALDALTRPTLAQGHDSLSR